MMKISQNSSQNLPFNSHVRAPNDQPFSPQIRTQKAAQKTAKNEAKTTLKPSQNSAENSTKQSQNQLQTQSIIIQKMIWKRSWNSMKISPKNTFFFLQTTIKSGKTQLPSSPKISPLLNVETENNDAFMIIVGSRCSKGWRFEGSSLVSGRICSRLASSAWFS